ncbi:MAG: nucleotidyltransferase domain-containing protein [Desulfobacteraceae bacterium]|nr:nucleotidyltransferase domain-containing protein [Desulfobacteraceae bacterium]
MINNVPAELNVRDSDRKMDIDFFISKEAMRRIAQGQIHKKSTMMNSKDLETANKLKSLLEKRVKLHQMILFGSRARGDADADSDMDLQVILDEPVSRQSRKMVSDSAWETGFEAGIVLVPVVVSRDNWESGPNRASLLAKAVREEGMRI